MYQPNPIDTSDIELDDELFVLTERLAKNVHDVWATGRIAEGWTFGEKKEPEKKKTPFLVPYEELPESEKDYDRNTAIETIKTVIKLGFEIKRSNR